MNYFLTVTLAVWAIYVVTYTSDGVLAWKVSERIDLEFPKLADYDGYDTETHKVSTRDGYILTLFRLPLSGKCEQNSSKVPILFVHGLYLSGDDCIVPGPGEGHCYIYADRCHDVWVANIRGNRYSRRHLTLNPDRDREYWDFDLDEFSKYDLSAIIDYVLNETGRNQLAYVGHAQGFAMLLVLCSEMPEYNDKITVGFGISPTTWLGNATFIVANVESSVAPALSLASDRGLNVEILPHGGVAQKSIQALCGTSSLSYPLCSAAYFSLFGFDAFQLTEEVLAVATGHGPAGTSLKAFARWGQIKTNGFSHYDYGSEENIRTYNTSTPPLYDLTKVTTKIVAIASLGDNVADPKDLTPLMSALSNAESCILSDERFAHLDFIYGKGIKTYVTPTILDYLSSGRLTCY